MDLTRLVALVIYTLGAFSFGALLAFWLRQVARTVGNAPPSGRWKALKSNDLFGGALSLACATWFVVCALQILVLLTPGLRRWPLQTVSLVLVYLFPPLLVHAAYLDTAAQRDRWGQGRDPSRAWWTAVPMTYAISLSILAFFLAVFYGVFDVQDVARFIGPSVGLLFTGTAAYGIAAAMTFKKRKETTGERHSRRSTVALFLVFGALCALLVLPGGGQASRSILFQTMLQSIPLAFLFVGTFFESRFEFFDIFVKRGTSLLLSIVLLTASFAVVLPWAGRVDFGWAAPWIYAILFLPVVSFLPWISRRLGEWLDSVWLGRRFTTVEAVKYFLSLTQSATTEKDLLKVAERALSAIFSAPTRIDLEGDGSASSLRFERSPRFEVVHEQPLRLKQSRVEMIQAGGRTSASDSSGGANGRIAGALGEPERSFGPADGVREPAQGKRPGEAREDEGPFPDRSDAPRQYVRSTPGRCHSTTETGGEEADVAREAPMGIIRMGRRVNQTPFFSEDLALLGSLSDVLASVLESLRLHGKKQEQERLAQELSLHASRSELKALRAQINPHFLFNALNAIAGLIHKDPARADKTVEQLAEVFRYTLRRSESEWTKLEDEVEFVRAYLEVEKARFGERLQVTLSIDETFAAVRIPTMVLQTLVENAVKHGISAVRGPGRIEIAARRSEGKLVLEVADTGPGLMEAPAGPDPGRSGPRSFQQDQQGSRQGEGYGLKNLQERLKGYYGSEARIVAGRDAARGMTVVFLEIPVSGPEGPVRSKPDEGERAGRAQGAAGARQPSIQAPGESPRANGAESKLAAEEAARVSSSDHSPGSEPTGTSPRTDEARGR